MAAIATNYFETGRSLSQRISERNTELLATQQLRRRGVRSTMVYGVARAADGNLLEADAIAVVG